VRYPGQRAPRAVSWSVDVGPAPSWIERARWIAIAFIPSSLMLGVTTFLSDGVASVPLLWVIPLATYLLTFIIAFSRLRKPAGKVAGALLPLLIVAAVVADPRWLSAPIALIIAVHLLTLFVIGVSAHGRLASERPAPAYMTEFYLCLSIGGVLGGAFNALAAPLIFDAVVEYRMVIILALLLIPFRTSAVRSALATRVFRVARPMVVATIMLGLIPLSTGPALYRTRTFFGVLQVRDVDGLHVLAHGTTVHGAQHADAGSDRDEPLTYYTRSGPIGQVFDQLQRQTPFRSVAFVGLGAGTLAAYGVAGQHFTFYEIDPAVVQIASDPDYFTYLQDSRAAVNVVIGDGRLKLTDAPDGSYDLLVLDAFSSDSVPAHLLTREALQLYLQKLQPGGAIAFHISNRFVELEPVLAADAHNLGLVGLAQTDRDVTPDQLAAGKQASHWVVMARSASALGSLPADPSWHTLQATPGADLWTDDFTNIVSTIKWFK
jgi:hypothetical protein